MQRLSEKLDCLFNRQRFVRRLVLAWSCWLITIVVLRVTEPDIITHISAAGATVVTAVIGILTTVIGFYQWSRQQESGK